MVVPDDDVLLTRMCFFVLIIINTADPQTVWALLFYSVICDRGFLPTKMRPLTMELFPCFRLI